jgi:hypothetical protein
VTQKLEDLGQPIRDVAEAAETDAVMWSVTTIIDVIDKPAIVYWACEQTANAAIDSVDTWQAMMADQGRDETVSWLRDARNRRPKTTLSDKDLGTIVHDLIEYYGLSGKRPDRDYCEEKVVAMGGPRLDVAGEVETAGRMFNQFDSWAQQAQPVYQATEVTVYSPTYGYAGTADAFLTIDGVRFIADYKTSRKSRTAGGKPKTPYPEQVGLQLGAYRFADHAAIWRPRRTEKFSRRYYLLGATERELAVPVPEVDAGLVIQITPESCESFPINVDREAHTAFLYALEVFRWVEQTSKSIMGQPLTFPKRGDDDAR